MMDIETATLAGIRYDENDPYSFIRQFLFEYENHPDARYILCLISDLDILDTKVTNLKKELTRICNVIKAFRMMYDEPELESGEE
jgi:hypothetical protein